MKRSRLPLGFGLAACAAALAIGVFSWPPRAAPTIAEDRVAQTYSPRCQTPAGICYVDALPVGSPCYCTDSGQAGTIIP